MCRGFSGLLNLAEMVLFEIESPGWLLGLRRLCRGWCS